MNDETTAAQEWAKDRPDLWCPHGNPRTNDGTAACVSCSSDTLYTQSIPVQAGDILVPSPNGWVKLSRWSPRYWWHRAHARLIDVVSWVRELPIYWRAFKVGMEHGRESPGCGLQGMRMYVRWDEHRGTHYYCTACQRPMAKFE